MICHTCPQQAAPHAQALLQALHGLFRADEEPGARDNAAGAVGRMLLAMGGAGAGAGAGGSAAAAATAAALPVEQIVPVLAGALPLQEDHEETLPAVAALCQLLGGAAGPDAQQRAAQHLGAVVAAFGRVAAHEAAPEAAKRQAARALAGMPPAQVGPMVAALPAEQRQALEQLAAA